MGVTYAILRAMSRTRLSDLASKEAFPASCTAGEGLCVLVRDGHGREREDREGGEGEMHFKVVEMIRRVGNRRSKIPGRWTAGLMPDGNIGAVTDIYTHLFAR